MFLQQLVRLIRKSQEEFRIHILPLILLGWISHGRHLGIIDDKVKCTLVQALRLCTGRTTHRGRRGIALLFLDHGTRRGEGSASLPGRSSPPEKTRYPLYRRLGGPHGRSGQVQKISPQPGFDPRTVQPVASRYTDYATRPTSLILLG